MENHQIMNPAAARQSALINVKGQGLAMNSGQLNGNVIFWPKKLVMKVGTAMTMVMAAMNFMMSLTLLEMIEA